MPEFVRVTDPDTGAHVTVTAGRAKALGLTPLKQSGADRFGNPLPAKPRVDLGASASGTTKGDKTPDTKKGSDA